MIRRGLAYLAIVALLACQGEHPTQPRLLPESPPAFAIVDGGHPGGNPDFFWLLPLQLNTRKTPNWSVGQFNPNLTPNVVICRLAATQQNQVQPPPNPISTFNPATECSGGILATLPAPLAPGAKQLPDDFKAYLATWIVPRVGPAPVFYRISVLVGATRLGLIDIVTVATLNQLKNVDFGNFAPYVAGLPLPITFRVENYALCDPPGVGPCGSATVDLSTGGTVTAMLPNSTAPSGVTIPPEGPGSSTFTVQKCPDLPVDLPLFGSCVRITADPPVGTLPNAATIFICDLSTDVINADLLEDQEHRITPHRLDGMTVTALPHAPGCPVSTSSLSFKAHELLASLRRGHWSRAGRALAAMIGPKPLYAMIDQGGGGQTGDFSDFQFALPAKMQKDVGDNQNANPGATLPINPGVLVTDLADQPVPGAKVTFATTAPNGTVVQSTFMTDSYGKVAAAWTLPGAGSQFSLTASGRGIAGENVDGPRPGFDPFQAIQCPTSGVNFGEYPSAPTCTAPQGPPVGTPLSTGSVTFHATVNGPVDLFGFGGPVDAFSVSPTAAEPTTGCETWHDACFVPGDEWITPGTMPFGSGTYEGCTINTGSANWMLNTSIFVRKTFTTPYMGTLTLSLRIDNDAQVWLDGQNITATGSPTTSNSYLHAGDAGPDDDLWIHENCADNNAPTFTVPNVTAGSHVLAIEGVDRGGASYFDMKLHLAP